MAFLWGKLCLYAGGFSSLLATFNPHPFAEGSTKQSHEGIYGDDAPLDKYGRPAVIKKLKNASNKSRMAIKHDFHNDIETHQLTAKYASIWNQMNANANDPNHKTIHVQIPFITQIEIKRNRLMHWFGFNSVHSNGEYITVEDYLQGKFEKFNSNTGWHKCEKSSINAFSHWTYHHSNGQHLVCDLQGVESENDGCYELTDPVIMSKEKKFGVTDLGVIGISNWFYHHKCNEFCDDKWLKPKVIEKCDNIDCDEETSHSLDMIDF